MRHLFTHELGKMKSQLWKILGFFLVCGVLPFLHFHYFDGVYYQRVLSFNDGVNPMKLRTQYGEYCPGDAVYVETSFTKQRPVDSVVTYWWVSNGSLVQVNATATTTGPQLPVGDYPKVTTNRVLLFIHNLPEAMDPGVHYSIGLSKHILINGQVREQDYQTLGYLIKKPEECNQG